MRLHFILYVASWSWWHSDDPLRERETCPQVSDIQICSLYCFASLAHNVLIADTVPLIWANPDTNGSPSSSHMLSWVNWIIPWFNYANLCILSSFWLLNIVIFLSFQICQADATSTCFARTELFSWFWTSSWVSWLLLPVCLFVGSTLFLVYIMSKCNWNSCNQRTDVL